MNNTDLTNLKKIKGNLLRIKEHGTAPINLTQYRKMGLIEPHSNRLEKSSTFGVRDRTVSKIRLTEKGRNLLKVSL